MNALGREHVANADEVDGMLGTTGWKVEAHGNHGDLQALTLIWIDGTHQGYPLQRRADTRHTVVNAGHFPTDGRYLGENDLHDKGLIVRVDALDKVQSYLRVPISMGMADLRRSQFIADGAYHCPIGHTALFVGRLLGRRTGR